MLPVIYLIYIHLVESGGVEGKLLDALAVDEGSAWDHTQALGGGHEDTTKQGHGSEKIIIIMFHAYIPPPSEGDILMSCRHIFPLLLNVNEIYVVKITMIRR